MTAAPHTSAFLSGLDAHLVATEAALGFFTRSEALAAGMNDRQLTRLIQGGELHRVRAGAYCSGAVWASLDGAERHRTRARAVLRSTHGNVALSHTSALIAAGVSVWGADLDRVHVTRLDGASSRRERDVVHHRGLVAAEDLVVHDGLTCTRPVRAAIEHGSIVSTESALVSMDSLLHLGLADQGSLIETFRALGAWPGVSHLRFPVVMATPLAESVGESRARWLFRVQQVPLPELQVPVHDDRGVLIGIADFKWREHGLLGEFDGRVKYGRLRRPGDSVTDTVLREKWREDAMREASGCAMIRYIWEDLDDPRRTRARTMRALGLG